MKGRKSWFRHFMIVLAMLLILLGPAAGPLAAQGASKPARAEGSKGSDAGASFGPLMFIENMGQFDESARFQVRGAEGTVWLDEGGLWISALEPADKGERDPWANPESLDALSEEEAEPRGGVNLRMTYEDANAQPELEPFDRLDTKVSYFIGNDPEQWHADVPVWGGVRYKELYPGIDLEITSENGQLIQRLVAREGADLSAVAMSIEGADDLALETGRVCAHTAVGDVSVPLVGVTEDTLAELAPATVEGEQVASPYCEATLGLEQVSAQAEGEGLVYSTFLGGTGNDYGYDPAALAADSYDIAVDDAGQAYVVGYTNSDDYPVGPGYDLSRGGSQDVFVSKLSATGTELLYSTFLGGEGRDYSSDIAVDSAGQAYVAGYTRSDDYPVGPGYDLSYNGGVDPFVSKLSAMGTELVYSTYLGGVDTDYSSGIAVDSAGQAYVVGIANYHYPAGPGYDVSFNGLQDVFVSKLSAAGTEQIYNTLLGGRGYECGSDIAVNSAGEAYVVGYTESDDYPVGPGYDLSRSSSGYDVFVSKLNATGTELVYSTFLGGGGFDRGYGIAVDSAGQAYVTGNTQASNYPVGPGYDLSYNGDTDVFVSKLSAAGTELIYSTFLGGAGKDYGYGLAVDSAGQAYVVGNTYSDDYPVEPGYDLSYNGDSDVFVSKLSATGTELVYSTFLGGAGKEYGYGIALGSAGQAYVTGYTESEDYPVGPGYDLSFNGGDCDAFVSKLNTRGTSMLYLPVLLRQTSEQ